MEPETATFPLNTRPPLIREWVPQVRYGVRANGGRRFNGELPITFAIGVQAGMSLHDAINERYEGLVGRDDEMFTTCECTAISLRIQVRTTALLKLVRGVRCTDSISFHSGQGANHGLATYVHLPST